MKKRIKLKLINFIANSCRKIFEVFDSSLYFFTENILKFALVKINQN